MRPVEAIQPHNPLLQVPVLYDAGHCLFGTGLIVDYLFATYPGGPMADPPLAGSVVRAERHWEDRLILQAIEGMSNTLIGLRLLLANGAVEAPYVQREWRQVWAPLDWLEARITPEGFWPSVFSVMDIALLCPMLFAQKRGMIDGVEERWPGIAAMIARWSTRASVQATPINELRTAPL